MLHDPQLRISNNYRDLNTELHQREPMYGTTGRKYVGKLRELAREYKARSILDYGCGKRDLWKMLHEEIEVLNFDPALPEFDTPPPASDLVACIDVLEHVESEFLDNVLADIASLTIKAAFFTIATQPSGKCLFDGTNCHRIIQSAEWWLSQLGRHFQIVRNYQPDQSCLIVLASSRA